MSGGFLARGFLSRGFLSRGLCPGGFCLGVFVLIPSAGTNDDTFPARFPNIFVDYPLGDKLWTNWNKAPMRLWQTQLNYAVFCASSACGVSSVHLNYSKHSVVRAVYYFHVYYHVR